MQDSPGLMREDVTVSLNRDLIDVMLGIAEVRGITLSVLIRDILRAFCQAYNTGSDWTQPDVGRPQQILPSSGIGEDQDQIPVILSRIAAHDEMIAALVSRIAALESGSVSARDDQIQPMAAAFPAVSGPGIMSGQNQASAVIDCDSPLVSTVSDDALVRIRPPVSPVITSVDLTSIGRIDPQRSYSQTEAAALLGISLSTIRKHVREGRILSQKVGRSIIFQGKDLLAAQQRVQ